MPPLAGAAMMPSSSDTWYVRLPTGRVVRARSTTRVRYYLGKGRIPTNCQVRRSHEDPWQALGQTPEFSDYAVPITTNGNSSHAPRPGSAPDLGILDAPSVASRLDLNRLQTLGLPAVLQDMLAALESALAPRKLLVALVACLLTAVVLLLDQAGLFQSDAPWGFLLRAVPPAAIVLIGSAALTLLTQLTYFEVSTLERARFRDGVHGAGPLLPRIAVVLAALTAALVFLLIGLQQIPAWVLDTPRLNWSEEMREAVAGAVFSVGMVLQVALWVLIALAMLLPPLLAVEQCGVGPALGQWYRLLRAQPGRAFVSTMLALGIGLLLSATLAAPVWLALTTTPADPRLAHPAEWLTTLLQGLAVAPLFAYLAVANVFIYLNLCYEHGTRS